LASTVWRYSPVNTCPSHLAARTSRSPRGRLDQPVHKGPPRCLYRPDRAITPPTGGSWPLEAADSPLFPTSRHFGPRGRHHTPRRTAVNAFLGIPHGKAVRLSPPLVLGCPRQVALPANTEAWSQGGMRSRCCDPRSQPVLTCEVRIEQIHVANRRFRPDAALVGQGMAGSRPPSAGSATSLSVTDPLGQNRPPGSGPAPRPSVSRPRQSAVPSRPRAAPVITGGRQGRRGAGAARSLRPANAAAAP
jgi:hypothetical protein